MAKKTVFTITPTSPRLSAAEQLLSIVFESSLSLFDGVGAALVIAAGNMLPRVGVRWNDLVERGRLPVPAVSFFLEFSSIEEIVSAIKKGETAVVSVTFPTFSGPMTASAIIMKLLEICGSGDEGDKLRKTVFPRLTLVVGETLLRRADGKGVVSAYEVLRTTPCVSDLIQNGHLDRLGQVIKSGQKFGMISLDQSIYNLYRMGVITRDVALSACVDRADMARRMIDG